MAFTLRGRREAEYERIRRELLALGVPEAQANRMAAFQVGLTTGDLVELPRENRDASLPPLDPSQRGGVKAFTLDAEFAVSVYSPVCSFCRHLRIGGPEPRCAAFPEGVPMAIWTGENQHRSPYPGDHGIRFEPATRAEGER